MWTEKKDEAIKYYQLGMEEFMHGIKIQLDSANNSRGLSIQEKMESNLMMAIERVEELNKQAKNQKGNWKRLRLTL